MTLIFCIDKKDGVMFGNRRQTKDRVLCEEILSLTEGKKLFVSPYSAPLFPKKKELFVSDDPAKEAAKGDFVFLENTPPPKDNIERVFLFNWNRQYPATRFFDRKILSSLSRKESVDFPGYSHEKITKELWQK